MFLRLKRPPHASVHQGVSALLMGAAALFGLVAVASASINGVGVPNGSAKTLTYDDGGKTITATMTISPTTNNAINGTGTTANMKMSSFWAGSLSSSEKSQSDANLAIAYTPNNVVDSTGLFVLWRAKNIPSFQSNWSTLVPFTSTAVGAAYRQADVAKLKFTFSEPVTNHVFHLNNIGGARRKNTTSDITIFSDYTLISGQSIKMLSGSTTNIMLDGNTIKPKNVPQDVGAYVGTGTAPFPDKTNGIGSGSFAVVGTYTEVEFEVGMSVALVNASTPADYDGETPEGVAFQWSIPAPLTVTTAVVEGQGTVTPASQTVAPGANGSFTIAPASGWVLDSVEGDTCEVIDGGNGNWTTDAIDEDCAITVKFVEPLTVTTAVVEGQGTVGPASQTVAPGANGSFTIAPASGWVLDSVEGDTCEVIDGGNGNWTTDAIDEDCAITVKFVEPLTVTTAVVEGQGTVGPASQTVAPAANGSFTIAPASGWVLDSVEGDTCEVIDGGNGNWTTNAIDEDCAITVKFIKPLPVPGLNAIGLGVLMLLLLMIGMRSRPVLG